MSADLPTAEQAQQGCIETDPAPRTMKSVFGFEVDESEQSDIISAQLDAAGAQIMGDLALPAVACGIFDAHLATPDDHSCLGCNLQVAVQDLAEFLLEQLPGAAPRVRLHLSLELVNVLWERISDVCKSLQVPVSLWSGDEREFAAFKRARAWSNFMKHPGFFGLGIHHPIYLADDTQAATDARRAHRKRGRTDRAWALIDEEFVKANWSADHTGETAARELRPSFTACVILPNMESLSVDLIAEFHRFVNRMQEPTWVELARKFAITTGTFDWWG